MKKPSLKRPKSPSHRPLTRPSNITYVGKSVRAFMKRIRRGYR